MHSPSKKIVRRGAVVFTSAAFLATLAAMPAMAISAPPGTITGNATVNAGTQTISMALDNSSFNVSLTQGQMTDTPNVGQGTGKADVNATVQTTFDPSGYSLTEQLTPAAGFSGPGSNTLSDTAIAPFTDNTAGVTDGLGQGNFGTNNPATIENSGALASGGTPSGGASSELAWRFTVPSNQAPGAYTGQIGVVALTN